mmetsp:Transcript_25896/g.24728  ORF Transcript_25896/g.24728 Transcript_25896/m.24728 type:complete len:328 (+) Transcript_25896:198-1181(+)
MSSYQNDDAIKKPDLEIGVGIGYSILEENKEDIDNSDFCKCHNCLSPSQYSCSICCCYGTRCSYKMNPPQLVLLTLLIILVLLYAIFGMIPFDHAIQPIRPLTTEKPSAISNQSTRVLLYGDSQWGIVERHHHLTEKIQAYLPEYPMNFTVVGDSAVKAKDLNLRLLEYKHVNPHIVLINIDSDVSNVNEDILSVQERTIVRDHYRGNLSAVVEFWINTGALVALGGPGLLGEGSIRPPQITRFKNKVVMSNAYVDMNKEISAFYGIPFMDFRAKLKSMIPWYRFYYNGYVTRDGEHPNERGTGLESTIIANVMLDWFRTHDHWNLK